MRRILFVLLTLAACAQSLQAQVQVTLTLKRHFYMVYEPLIATITVSNLAGRDLPLADGEGHPWFGFNITREDGNPLAPIDLNYQLTPLTIPAGATVKRSVNLNELYPVHEFGTYKVRAVIYFSLIQKFFESAPVTVEISEGKTLWRQEMGVPDGEPNAGAMRRVSLLKFRQIDRNILYARVEDPDKGKVYCTVELGRLLDNMEPQVLVDSFNRLHVLQAIASKTYLYSEISTSGGVSFRKTYLSERTRPEMHRDAAGEVTIVGGVVQEPVALKPGAGTGTASGDGVPKLSDRPVALPK